MLILVQQILILFIFVLTGFFLCRGGLISQALSDQLSKLEMYVFMPCLVFHSFAADFTRDKLAEKADILLVALLLLAVTWLLSYFLSKCLTEDRYEQSIYAYTFAVPNFAFMGYGLINAVYGSEMLLNMVIFGLPLTVYIYTEGYRRLCGKDKISLRAILNPAFIAIFIGAFFGLTNTKAPSILLSLSEQGMNCVTPIAMLLTGTVIAQFNFRALLSDKRLYLASAIRLIIFPLAVWGVLRLLGVQEALLILGTMVYAMPSGMNTIVYPQLAGKDCRLGAGLLLITSTAALITLPLIMRLVS